MRFVLCQEHLTRRGTRTRPSVFRSASFADSRVYFALRPRRQAGSVRLIVRRFDMPCPQCHFDYETTHSVCPRCASQSSSLGKPGILATYSLWLAWGRCAAMCSGSVDRRRSRTAPRRVAFGLGSGHSCRSNPVRNSYCDRVGHFVCRSRQSREDRRTMSTTRTAAMRLDFDRFGFLGCWVCCQHPWSTAVGELVRWAEYR